MSTKALPNVIARGSRNTGGRKTKPRTHHVEADPRRNGAEVFVRNGHRAVVCDGAAHSNANIDDCLRCAPMWGVLAVKVNP